MGLRERLENLVANPLLADSSDYDFAKGLLEYYNRKGHLTSGRRPWLDKLEHKYDPDNFTDPLAGNPTAAAVLRLIELPEVAQRDRDFLGSLKQAIARWGHLTERQQDALGRITERYSDEGKTRRSNWAGKYETLRPQAVIAAQYYLSNPPYYGDLAQRIVVEDSFVPSEKQYNAITQNKYAQKVIKATLSEPLYTEGSMIEGRAGGNYKLRGKKAFILKVNHGHVTNAAKGTKKYLVLPVGQPAPIVVEEREIKKVKKRK